MICWAIEYRVNPSSRRPRWHLDLRTVRSTRHAAKQAPLDIDTDPAFWDEYNARLREGNARAVKLRIVEGKRMADPIVIEGPSLHRAMELAADYASACGAFGAASAAGLEAEKERARVLSTERYRALANYLRPYLSGGVKEVPDAKA